MKSFSNFLIKLKPYRRLYKIFWMCFIIIFLFIFQILMLSFSYLVPHKEGGFYYWINGLYALFANSRQEPNSAQGFIFAATIIGFIPIIPIIPILYFTFANWFIQEKLSDRFINVGKEKYLYWSKFIHFSGIAIIFLLIPGALSYMGGGSLLPHKTYVAIQGTFTTDLTSRVAGISAFLYYGVGCVFAIIIIFWVIWIALQWIGRQIQKLLNMIKLYLDKVRDSKRIQKLEKLQKKQERKKTKK
ncbi:hypothetical protein [Spiroplasma taiwanense]|uniref:Transmembrane protein n=1 Tax=Spiroplasma taiwanense CT-1 TaxID=1276220 RepID=S5LUE2_9MOLU|nr:hypothetical protein [Spiroplasma taiwanense]AGR41404.1 hypothetical protein STAIW_v1c08160 [Spiroplasma taiwanense CT-1]